MKKLMVAVAVAGAMAFGVRAATSYTWSGLGDGKSWSDKDNWYFNSTKDAVITSGSAGETYPSAGDSVYFTSAVAGYDAGSGFAVEIGEATSFLKMTLSTALKLKFKSANDIQQKFSYSGSATGESGCITISKTGSSLAFENLDIDFGSTYGVSGQNECAVDFTDCKVFTSCRSRYGLNKSSCTFTWIRTEFTLTNTGGGTFGNSGTKYYLEDCEWNASTYYYFSGSEMIIKGCTFTTSSQYFNFLNGTADAKVELYDTTVTAPSISLLNAANCTAIVSNCTFDATASVTAAGDNADVSIYDSTITVPSSATMTVGTAAGTRSRLYLENTAIELGGLANSGDAKFTQSGADSAAYLKNSSISLRSTATASTSVIFTFGGSTSGLITLDDSQIHVLAPHGRLRRTASTNCRFLIKGKTSQVSAPRINSGSNDFACQYDFEVPVGGYDRVPVYNPASQSAYNFFNTAGNTINVLPSSPAAQVDGTAVYPLVCCPNAWLKLANVDLSQSSTPNNASILMSTVTAGLDDTTAGAADWTSDTAAFANDASGVAVRIVGEDQGKIALSDFANTALGPEEGATFVYALAAGAAVKSATVTVSLYEQGGDEPIAVKTASHSAAGAYSVNFAASLLTSGKTYVAKIAAVNDDDTTKTATADDVLVEVNFDKPIIAGVRVSINDGDAFTVSGTLSHLGGGATCGMMSVLVADNADLTGATEIAVAGQLEPGDSFDALVTGVEPNATCYYAAKVVTDTGVELVTAPAAVTMLGASAAVTDDTMVQVDCRKVAISGSFAALGAGTTRIRFHYTMDEGETWLDVYAEDAFLAGDPLAFQTIAVLGTDAVGKTIAYQVFVENATGSGAYFWTNDLTTTVAAVDVTDANIYTWKDVDGEWSGDWTDARHWECNSPYPAVYPTGKSVKIDLSAIPAGTPVTIEFPVSVSLERLTAADGQDLTFKGTAAGVNVTGAFNGFNKAESKYTFDAISWTTDNDTVGKNIVPGRDSVYTIKNGSSIAVTCFNVSEPSIWLLSGDSRISTTVDSSFGIDNGEMYFEIDGSKLDYRFGTSGISNGALRFRFKGKNPLLELQNRGIETTGCMDAVTLEFEIPEGGYAATPVQQTSRDRYWFHNQGGQENIYTSGRWDGGIIKVKVLDSSYPIVKGVEMSGQLVSTVFGFGTYTAKDGTVLDEAKLLGLEPVAQSKYGNRLEYTTGIVGSTGAEAINGIAYKTFKRPVGLIFIMR